MLVLSMADCWKGSFSLSESLKCGYFSSVYLTGLSHVSPFFLNCRKDVKKY
jgi:hypothetical protein